MTTRRSTWTALGIWLLLALPAASVTAGEGPAAADVVRAEGEAFGERAVIEILGEDPPQAAASARAALDRMTGLEREIETAIKEPELEPGDIWKMPSPSADLIDLLERALHFCAWSGGANGPLGGNLAAHWRAVGGNPSPPPVPVYAVETATCDRIEVEHDARTVRLAAGSRIDLSGFAPGFAVDRAVDLLRERGVSNALVRLGRICRAIGPGPDSEKERGWPVLLPTFEGYQRPLEEITLHDQSLAVVWRADWPAGTPLFVDQRTGAQPKTAWATVAVTEIAIDAQAVATSALVLGSREGRFRIAGLKPKPSVLWLLGRGTARPLLMDFNWSTLRSP